MKNKDIEYFKGDIIVDRIHRTYFLVLDNDNCSSYKEYLLLSLHCGEQVPVRATRLHTTSYKKVG